MNIQEKLFTVKELAQIMGVSSDIIKNCIRRVMPNKMQNGKRTELNEIEVSLITKELKQNTHSKTHLTYEESSQVESTKTRLEILANYKQASDEMILLLSQEKEALELRARTAENKLIEQAPAVNFYNTIGNAEKNVSMQEAAKLLKLKNTGRTNLFTLLRSQGILDNKNAPYQRYIDAGYFHVIEVVFYLPNGKQGVSLKTLVTQKGLKYLHNRFAEKVDLIK